MSPSPRRWRGFALALGVLAAHAPVAEAYVRHRPPVPSTAPREGVGFSEADINVVENLGQRIPAGLRFVDGHGHKVAVDDLLGKGLPLLVTLGYYRCPQLCNLVHEGLAKGLKAAELVPGKDFQGLSISVDPGEDPKSATTNQRRLLRSLGEPASGTWPFLMPEAAAAGINPSIEKSKPIEGKDHDGRDPMAIKLAESVGFKYKYDPKSRQFAHAAVAFVLAPDGKISRYLYGVDFKPRDLRLALVEASGGRVGTTLDRILLTCFKYDPMIQKYTPYAFGFVRIGALLSFAALATLLGVLWRREWVTRRRRLA
jgi:protein SCO1/2